MTWIDLEYPATWWIVEVKYGTNGDGSDGDVGVSQVRGEIGRPPKARDNRYGFTKGFASEADANRYAVHVARELAIPTCIKAS